MFKIKYLLILSLLILTFTSCSSESDKVETENTKEVKTEVVKANSNAIDSSTEKVTKKKTLLFFLNPHGRPCQMQDEILTKTMPYIKELCVLEYVSTGDKNARSKFNQYGIRSLPSLILLDEDGKEMKRFAPGIQRAGLIMASVEELD